MKVWVFIYQNDHNNELITDNTLNFSQMVIKVTFFLGSFEIGGLVLELKYETKL